jgi:hypothetical protein
MTPKQKADEVIERLMHKIEMTIIVFCIIIITVCCVVGYVVHPMMGKSSLHKGYEKLQRFSLPLGDTTGTEAYEERTVTEHTDNWGIHYVSKQRIK